MKSIKACFSMFLFLMAASASYAVELFLDEGRFRIEIVGESPEYADLLIDGDDVRFIPAAASKIIQGGIIGKFSDRKLSGFINSGEKASINGTLIADNTIDAIISSPKSSAKVCRIVKTGGISENLRKEISRVNMEHIGIALKKYSRLTNFDYPKSQGAAAFDELRKKGHLTDSRYLVCPGTKTEAANSEEVITERHVDYIYAPIPDNFTLDAVPIAWDRPGNFVVGAHVLFSDGKIIWLGGDNWQDKIVEMRTPKTEDKQPK